MEQSAVGVLAVTGDEGQQVIESCAGGRDGVDSVAHALTFTLLVLQVYAWQDP